MAHPHAELTPEARLARLVLQHARTAELLGVDAVPVYTAGPLHAHERPAPQAAPQVASDAEPPEAAPTPSAPLAPGLVPRLQPAAPRSELFAAHTPTMPLAIAPIPNWELKPVPRQRDAVVAALKALRARYESDAPHQHFVTAHTNIVFDDGDPCARLMFIGEAPGADEDRTGVPFVGRAGQLLNKMIAAMGLAREQVYIANVLKTRPPDNATPTTDEIRLCAPYLYEQIRIVGPEVIVTLGLPATRALLGTAEPMARLRGRWASFQPLGPGSHPIPVMPTYHPAFLLRSYTDENRRKVWSDLQLVVTKLSEKSGTSSNSPATV